MPSKSAAQKRTMAAAAHNSGFARKMGIPQSVAKEYNRADATGGALAKMRAQAQQLRGKR